MVDHDGSRTAESRTQFDGAEVEGRAEERANTSRVNDDRDRIARDLHDVVIQRLFAIGMRLDAVRKYDMHPVVHSRISGTIDDLDLVIRDIRSTIFDLQRGPGDDGLRSAAMTLTVEAATHLGCTPRITFTGPVDSLVPEPVAANLLAVLQEALSNAVRHSLASAVEVSIEARADEVVLTVRDDGVGPADSPTGGDGLRNMTARAASLGGTCTVRPRRPLGTEVRWAVPLGD